MMTTTKTIRVAAHWYNDAGDAEIVWLKPLQDGRELQNDLFWYSGGNRPFWKPNTELTDSEVMATRPYKQRKMQSIESDIPNDCYVPFN